VKVKGFYTSAPSILSVGEEFTLKFKVLTEPHPVGWGCYVKPPTLNGLFNLSPRGIKYLDNVYDGDIEDVVIEIEGRKIKFSNYSGVFFGDKRRFGRVQGLRFNEPGIKFIRLIHPETGIETYSNPIIVEENPKYRIYWGDLHSQTFFSDGLRCPEELYTFAKEEAFLDFFSVSDHSEWITNRQWDYFCSVANDFNEQGKFATLIAEEWTDHKAGHRNIYYPDNTGRILRAGIDNIDTVYSVARKYGALIIPHHSANKIMGVNWNLSYDPQVEVLVEIYSVWGSSELGADEGNTRPIKAMGGEQKGQHVIDALNMGYRFGFVGGGDIHDGRPGDELHNKQEQPDDYKNLYRQGITAVKVKSIGRENIFNALYQRKCYATSNIKPILNFSINDVESGSILVNARKLHFEISGVSEVLFDRIVVMSDGKIYKSFNIKKNQFKIEFEQNYCGEQYFYVRIEREDGEIAWLSPIFMEV